MAKIAISLPDDVLRDVEAERLTSGESRSAFFRRAVLAFLRQKRERDMDAQYVRGYQQYPETEEEMRWAESDLARVLAESPWDADTQP